MSKRYILTGPPCSGKSTVAQLIALSNRRVVPEVARNAIAFFQEYEPSKLPWNDRDFFQKYVETKELENYFNYQVGYFDRSLVDEMAYRIFFSMPECENLNKNVKEYKYDKVFFFPFWDEIYEQDSERVETKEEAKLQEKLLIETYESLGYTLIFVPKMTPKERYEFIIKLS